MSADNGSAMRVEINGAGFNCRLDGPEGAPWLVFSNSLATNLGLWEGQVAAFGGAWRILRYDQRGHGGTGLPAGSCTFDGLADDAACLLDHFNVRDATFIGVSMGGITALNLALRHPERIARVVACDSPAASAPDAGTMWAERTGQARAQGMAALVEPTVGRWFRPGFVAANPPVLASVRRMIAGTSVGGYCACADALQNFDLTPALGRIAMPTLLLAGAADGVLPAAMRAMAARIPGAGFVEIAEAGHLPNIEQGIAFNAALSVFLSLA